MSKKIKQRFRFDYEVGAWVYASDLTKKKPVESKEISDERLLKSYLRIASKDGCLLDIIKNYIPWMSKDDLIKRMSIIKKDCLKNGYRLVDIPVKPKKKIKPKVEKKIDYGLLSDKNPYFLKKLSNSDDGKKPGKNDISENRKAYKAALDEHMRRLNEDDEYKKWHDGMTKEESRKAFQEEFMSHRESVE